MKKILLLLLFFSNLAFSQSQDLDATLQKITKEEDEDKKVELLVSLISAETNNNPKVTIETGLKLLKQSKGENATIEKAVAYSFLGQGYRLLGSNIKALDCHHKAIALAEKSNNLSILALAENQLAHIYKDREEYEKAISLYLSATAHADKGKNDKIKGFAPLNLGTVYLSTNNLDSSLMYSQRAYEHALRQKATFSLSAIFVNLGSVQSKMGNRSLAVSYFKTAINQTKGTPHIRYLNNAYTGLAEHYKRFNQSDSCSYYAKKAIASVNNTSFFYLSNKPALLLTGIYEKANCDSTLKYSKIYRIATDSLVSAKTNQQIQLMTFEEDLRQQELVQEKAKQEEQNQQTLQYIFIGIGILTLIILYLLLSQSFITNTNLIKFFGIIGLLIVFEFINLLVHPFLERVTHHSPILMLLALVSIAAMLVPLHHKAEHWALTKLIEKNKQIRLANAKKTIEELESE